MFRSFVLAAASAAFVVAAGAAATAGKSEGPVECVRLARSWESAIEEGKALNLPLVVHHHGFYCPPCWGMHASVMCNEKYIGFAAENTVEVIALQDLDKAMGKSEKNADEQRKLATYEGKNAKGAKSAFFCEFPGLTAEDLRALHASKASSYNDTGGIPFTAVIDPWTEKEMQRWAGGGKSVKEIMEGIKAQRAKLDQEHGRGVSRALFTKVTDEAQRIVEALPKAGVAASMADYRKLEKAAGKDAEALKAKLDLALNTVLEAAAAQLDDADARIAAGDAAGAKKLVDKLVRALAGTSLESRVTELAAKLKG